MQSRSNSSWLRAGIPPGRRKLPNAPTVPVDRVMTTYLKKRPWMKFFPADWRADPRLRMCSLAARGLWIDLIAYMHEGVPYGHLTIDGRAPDLSGIAALVARPPAEVKKALRELEEKHVTARTDEGVIYSRRMVRDFAKALRDHENGKDGGNPGLARGDKGGTPPIRRGLSPPIKPRSQKPEAKKIETRERERRARAKAKGSPKIGSPLTQCSPKPRRQVSPTTT